MLRGLCLGGDLSVNRVEDLLTDFSDLPLQLRHSVSASDAAYVSLAGRWKSPLPVGRAFDPQPFSAGILLVLTLGIGRILQWVRDVGLLLLGLPRGARRGHPTVAATSRLR